MERQTAPVWAVVSVVSSPQVQEIWKKETFVIKIYGIASLDIVIQEIIWYTINKVSMLCCSQANTLPIKCSFKGEGEEFIIKFSVVRSAWTFFVFFITKPHLLQRVWIVLILRTPVMAQWILYWPWKCLLFIRFYCLDPFTSSRRQTPPPLFFLINWDAHRPNTWLFLNVPQ